MTKSKIMNFVQFRDKGNLNNHMIDVMITWTRDDHMMDT